MTVEEIIKLAYPQFKVVETLTFESREGDILSFLVLKGPVVVTMVYDERFENFSFMKNLINYISSGEVKKDEEKFRKIKNSTSWREIWD